MGPVERSERRRRVVVPPRIPGRARRAPPAHVSLIDYGPSEGGAILGTELDDRLTAQWASWDSLKTDIYRSPRTDAAFRAAFMRDASAFDHFRSEHEGDWITTRAALAQAEQYRQRLESWRARFVALGERSTSPETDAPPPGLLEDPHSPIRSAIDAASETSSAVKWVAAAAIVAVGAWAVSRVV